ncbi:hypothetical protein [Cupriavidus nantongensis]|uniref:hypothetical protein n=1 Tax=Cupriavidus nantongensis TaxID=1796606 RepID=UPI002246914E|nr:hypothetical protein [Cupriavidus nantongensis]
MERDANQLDRPDEFAVHVVNFRLSKIDSWLVSYASPSFFKNGVVVPGNFRSATVINDVDRGQRLSQGLIAVWHQFNAYPQHMFVLLVGVGLLQVVQLASECFYKPKDKRLPSFLIDSNVLGTFDQNTGWRFTVGQFGMQQ